MGVNGGVDGVNSPTPVSASGVAGRKQGASGVDGMNAGEDGMYDTAPGSVSGL